MNLKILSIQSNRITKLEGLDQLINLEELYLSHNGLTEIEGLEKNVRQEFTFVVHAADFGFVAGQLDNLRCWQQYDREDREYVPSQEASRILGTYLQLVHNTQIADWRLDHPGKLQQDSERP